MATCPLRRVLFERGLPTAAGILVALALALASPAAGGAESRHLRQKAAEGIPANLETPDLAGAESAPLAAAAGTVREPPNGKLFAAAPVSGERWVVVGERGKIFLTADEGETWTRIECRTSKAVYATCFPDAGHGWAVGQAGLILHSGDGGQTWAPQAAGVESDLLAVDFADRLHGVVVGTESTVLTTEDAGKTWIRSPVRLTSDAGETFSFFAVIMLDSLRVCATGDSGRVFLSGDGGGSWTEANSPLYDREMTTGRILYDLAYDAGTLHAVGIDAGYVFSRDQGKTWTEGSTGLREPELFCLDFEDGLGMAAGSGGQVLLTRDGGSTWVPLPVPDRITRGWLSGLALGRDGAGRVRGLIVGQRGAVGRLREGTLDW